MFSSLASYLLGGGAAAAAETQSPAEAFPPPSAACLDAVDADDGWVLVDSIESSCTDSFTESTFVDLRLTVSAVTTAAPTTGASKTAGAGARGRRRGSRAEPRPPTPVAPDVGEDGNESAGDVGDVGTTAVAGALKTGDAGTGTPAGFRSRSSSSASLPCLRVDESWYVTPPPCFTSTGPIHMETSPLEDLLIEHPSMSVYHQHPTAAPMPVPAPQPTPAPTPQEAAGSETAARPRAGSLPPPAPRVVAPRPAPVPAPALAPAPRGAGTLRLKEQMELHKTAQKAQQRSFMQVLKRNPLERHNKAREYNGRNKVLRRSDRMLQHSGANNNRKC